MKISQLIELTATREEFIMAEGVNISEGGLQVLTTVRLDDLARVYFMVELKIGDKTEVLKGEGYVNWVKPSPQGYNTGIQFYGLTKEEAGLVAEFCGQAGMTEDL